MRGHSDLCNDSHSLHVRRNDEAQPDPTRQRNPRLLSRADGPAHLLNDKVRAASQAFGYQECDAPFLEPIDLYAAKSGEELVKEQSFVFTDRGGDEITLRPELTPTPGAYGRGRTRRTNLSRFAGGRSARSGATSGRRRDARASSSSGTLTCSVWTIPKRTRN